MKHFIVSTALIITAIGIHCARAAEGEQTLVSVMDASNGQRSVTARIGSNDIISGPSAERVKAIAEWTQNERVAILVPGFQPGDAEKYRYFIRRFHSTGGGGGTAQIDENGVLHDVRPYRINSEGEIAAVEHVYINSHNLSTGQNRYTFDLAAFPLLSFVHSLGHSLRPPMSPGTILSGEWPRRILEAEAVDPFAEDVIVRRLQGENLTFEETLDLLRQESGCDVIQAEGKLIIDWCG